jgi:hypothetical protein
MREKINVHTVSVGTLKGRYCHSMNLGVDTRIVPKQDRRVLDWIHLGQDRDERQAVLNTVMKIRGPYNAGNFFSN